MLLLKFTGAKNENEQNKDFSDLWGHGMSEGLDAIKFYGGATVGMRTMLDALEPGVLALKSGCKYCHVDFNRLISM